MALVPGGIIQLTDDDEELKVDPNAPYLSQLGWTMETLRTAQHYGHVLFDDRVIDELEKWEKEQS